MAAQFEMGEAVDFAYDNTDSAHDTRNGSLSQYGPYKYGNSAVSESPNLQEDLLKLTKNCRFEDAVKRITSTRIAEFSCSELAKDKHCRTAAHYAAGHSQGEATLKKLVERVSAECLVLEDDKKVTPMHLSTAYHSKQQFDYNVEKWKLPSGRKEVELLKIKDEDGDTPVHCAAVNKIAGESILASSQIDKSWLSWVNKRKQTVLMWAAKYLQADTVTVTQLIVKAGAECVELRDEDGETCLHKLTKSESNIEGLIDGVRALTLSGPPFLSWQNKRGQSVLHVAAANFPNECLTQLLHSALDQECLKSLDDEGNSVAHYAARNGDPAALTSTIEILGSECIEWKNQIGQSVLHIAVRNFNRVSSVLSHVRNASLKAHCDVDGNNLLHALFQPLVPISESDSDTFLEAMRSLLDAGVSPGNENKLGRTCLQGTTVRSLGELKALLTICQSLDKATRETLLHSSLHAIHVFSGKYDLECVVPQLQQLSGKTLKDLLGIRVANGPLKGATCLHFACEAGHKTNIQFLMNNGLELSAETDSGLSCIDVAFRKEKFSETESAVNELKVTEKPSQAELLRLLDPPERALKLPDPSAARQLLSSISDESMTTDVHRDTQKFTVRMAMPIHSNGSDNSSTEMKILQRAVEMDSSEIFRCALSINLISKNTEISFPNYLRRQLHPKDASKNVLHGDRFLELTADQTISSESELSIIDIVAFFDRVEVLLDLLLTRQFDLIPACVFLLIRLRPKISLMQGKHEQLKRLYDQVTEIATSALDELYLNATTEDDKKQIFRYIKGEIKGTGSLGPRFPCRLAVGLEEGGPICHLTLMELIEEADVDDLHATDCMHRLVQTEWETAPATPAAPAAPAAPAEPVARRCELPVSPRVTFFINLAFFVIFLAFFAWYVIDIRRTFQNRMSDLFLTAYTASFAFQEIDDIIRRKKRRNVYFHARYYCSCPVYFKDVLNIFDVLALLFMLTGLILKFTISGFAADEARGTQSIYACQMLLSTSFLLWGFRSVSFLSYTRSIGPSVSMLRCLLIQDLLPFLAIILIIFYAFGVFFFNLLFPAINAASSEPDSATYVANVFQQVLTLPFNLLFSNFDKTGFETASNGSDQAVGKVAHPVGFWLFNNLLQFLFLFLANIVMLNLLIARFSLTVSRMDVRMVERWRRTYFEMLREYQRISPVPPPLSFIYYTVKLFWWICCRKSSKDSNHGEQILWLNESNYPEEYNKFLRFQALQFRRLRPWLSPEVKRKKFGAVDANVQIACSEVVQFKTMTSTADKMQLDLKQKLQSMQDSTDKMQLNLQQKLQSMQDSTDKMQLDLKQKLQSMQDSTDKMQLDQKQKLQSMQDSTDKMQLDLQQKLQWMQDSTDNRQQDAEQKIAEFGGKLDKILELLQHRLNE